MTSSNNSGDNTTTENLLNAENENNNDEATLMENTDNTINENDVVTSGKTLVTYFSLPETRGNAKEDSTVTVNGEAIGNTQYVANLIQEPREVESWLKEVNIIQ